jgi:hypothetical protein
MKFRIQTATLFTMVAAIFLAGILILAALDKTPPQHRTYSTPGPPTVTIAPLPAAAQPSKRALQQERFRDTA